MNIIKIEPVLNNQNSNTPNLSDKEKLLRMIDEIITTYIDPNWTYPPKERSFEQEQKIIKLTSKLSHIEEDGYIDPQYWYQSLLRMISIRHNGNDITKMIEDKLFLINSIKKFLLEETYEKSKTAVSQALTMITEKLQGLFPDVVNYK